MLLQAGRESGKLALKITATGLPSVELDLPVTP
jgi:hypothetical protein